MDFTLTTYKKLLDTLKEANYTFYRFDEYLTINVNRGEPQSGKKYIILRHDVDRRPGNALETARIENNRGIKASYYFRIVKESFDTKIIREIAALGHEIGYHYEEMTLAKGDPVKAVDLFEKNLDRLRMLAPVRTLCMHGSPFSKWNNRELWKNCHYRDYGLIGEPYDDLDFSNILYLTDTGRRWDGKKMSVRDRVDSGFAVEVRTTYDLIESVKRGELPDRVMFNIHPERWDDAVLPWMRQLVWQNSKNIIKRFVAKKYGNLQDNK